MVENIVFELRKLCVETGSIACLGCGHEHNCGIHGCAIMREAADKLVELNDFSNSELARAMQENANLRAENERIRQNSVSHEVFQIIDEDRKQWQREWKEQADLNDVLIAERDALKEKLNESR